jgi:hypothetical protein
LQTHHTQADWLKLHSGIEKAAKGRNALAHHWVLVYPNDKPGRRWCLISRIDRMACLFDIVRVDLDIILPLREGGPYLMVEG